MTETYTINDFRLKNFVFTFSHTQNVMAEVLSERNRECLARASASWDMLYKTMCVVDTQTNATTAPTHHSQNLRFFFNQ